MTESMDCIDLHVHTTASDGSHTPAEIARYAVDKGLRAVGITDHDDTSGVLPAMEEGGEIGLEVIPGVELSMDSSEGTFHLLGYMIDPENRELSETLDKVKNCRNNRNTKILAKLRDLGMDITMKEILTEASDGAVGRPHFARVMLRKGYIGDYYEAFNRYLRKGGPAYVEREKLDIGRAVSVIEGAGGVAVLAHPHSLGLKKQNELEAFVTDLMDKGVKGMEVYYSRHSKHQTDLYMRIAEKFGLAVTGGSDFHGKNKPGVEIGVGRGRMRIPYIVAENLKVFVKEQRASGKIGLGI